MIHQTHVRRIIDAPPLKEGTGKKIRGLHDLVVHLRALKALGHEPSKPFITSLLEMKLDSTTMFEWQRHSQEYTDVPDYQILDFLNLRAQATEASSDKKRPARKPSKPNRRHHSPLMPLPQTFAYHARVKSTLSIHAPSSVLCHMLTRLTY